MPMKWKRYRPPSSKSVCHRAMICAAYCEEESLLRNVNFCEDVLATASALQSMGALIDMDEKNAVLRIKKGIFPSAPPHPVYCRDSASTLRLVLAQGLSMDEELTFTGSESLSKRPMDAYLELFERYGISYRKPENSDRSLPLQFKGRLSGESFHISTEKSSQFASGLMLLLGARKRASEIILEGGTESFDYLLLSAELMRKFGAKLEVDRKKVRIFPSAYRARELFIESDYSQASYFIALGLFAKGILIEGLNRASSQADRRILDLIERMGAKFAFDGDQLLVYPSKLKGCEIDVSECPDLAPTLAAMLSVAEGKSVIKGCSRLVYKESDRLHRSCEELRKLGAKIRVEKDRMLIEGRDRLHGAKLSTHGDHRLAMAFSILQAVSEGTIELDDTDCVNKSYPNFLKDLGEYYE